MTERRLRAVYGALAIASIAVGLWIHMSAAIPNARTRDVTGDAVWASMMAWWVGAATPRTSLPVRSVLTFGICVAVEVSQLVHGPVIDAVRSTTLGHLVLGSGFDSRDLAAYAIGVVAATLVELGVLRPGRS